MRPGWWGWPRWYHTGKANGPPSSRACVTQSLPAPRPRRLQEAGLTTLQMLLKAPNILFGINENIIPIRGPKL